MNTWKAESYRDRRGRTPVEEFLDQLSTRDRARVVHTVQLLQDFGLRLSLPYVKHLKGKLWELRVRAGRNNYRIIYFVFTGRRLILLHAFLKKTQKTPGKELAVAEQRMIDFLEREVQNG